MSRSELSNLEIADLCRELSLLLHSGVSVGDALYLMAEQERDPQLHALLSSMFQSMDAGCYLHQAFDRTECFPVYVIGLLRVSEEVGKTEETLAELAAYYESRERMRRQIVSALTYPSLLFLLMVVVIGVLLTKVLPIFNEIYMSLGGQLTGLAHVLLVMGRFLERIMPILCILILIILACAAVLFFHQGARRKISDFCATRWGDRGIARKLNNARFAQALSMAFSSGMLLEDAVELAAQLVSDSPKATTRCIRCREQLLNGTELSIALEENDLFSRSSCRLLTLGIRSGTADSVLREIANRMQEEAREAIEAVVSKVEPALVLLTSGMVGVILLSVMFPLMNIMTAIG